MGECAACATLQRKLDEARKNLQNAEGWLRTVELEGNAITYPRALKAVHDAMREIDLAGRKMENHARTHG